MGLSPHVALHAHTLTVSLSFFGAGGRNLSKKPPLSVFVHWFCVEKSFYLFFKCILILGISWDESLRFFQIFLNMHRVCVCVCVCVFNSPYTQLYLNDLLFQRVSPELLLNTHCFPPTYRLYHFPKILCLNSKLAERECSPSSHPHIDKNITNYVFSGPSYSKQSTRNLAGASSRMRLHHLGR